MRVLRFLQMPLPWYQSDSPHPRPKLRLQVHTHSASKPGTGYASLALAWSSSHHFDTTPTLKPLFSVPSLIRNTGPTTPFLLHDATVLGNG